MNILLIHPTTQNIITTTQASFVVQERGFVPPLGLLYLASAVQSWSKHHVKILDCQLHGLTYDQTREQIINYQPDVVGITVVTFSLIDSINVANLIRSCEKELNKKIHIVAGGPHVTIYPEETANLDPIDFALAGEAEFTFLNLINHLDDEDRLKKIPGVCFKKNGILIKGPPHGFIENLDCIPVPDRRLIDYDKYYNVLSGSNLMTTMMTSRGCPYRCIFCDRLGKRFRAASAERVIEEIEDCLSLGINYIFIHDDTFTVDKTRVLNICRLIQEKSLKIKFSLRSRVNTIDEDIIRRLKDAGCVRISFGVESGVQSILDRIKKGITLEQAENAFRLAKKYKMKTLADFMIGHPDETIEDIYQTISFAKKIKPDYVQFAVTTPYPATDLYREGLESGMIRRDVWKDFAENPRYEFIPPRWEQHIDKQTLYRMLHFCYKKFYLSPAFIMKNIISLSSLTDLKRKTKAGMKIFTHEMLPWLKRSSDGFR
ncbi:MAG: radical SAM protein [Desulfobacterales bacterium]|jgi:radical SAM superfamily enzyme YgiQ (UPF0313 family)|nr:radical SAM protein [Desulfobacterales bacterium]MDP6806673.1 radical SAM protein [Desulfobacterales bacterium]|tara:strand:+ start:33382 stop:34842 length:1461 start_codon:yes stop_codon:yes gene_type:complete